MSILVQLCFIFNSVIEYVIFYWDLIQDYIELDLIEDNIVQDFIEKGTKPGFLVTKLTVYSHIENWFFV